MTPSASPQDQPSSLGGSDAHRRARRLPIAAALASVLAVATGAEAHQFAPALLEIEENQPGRAAVAWKQPTVRVQGSRLRPVLPVECEGIGDPEVRREGTGMRATWEISCPGGVVGKTVGVEGIGSSRADVLLRVALLDGRRLRSVLTAEAPTFEIGAPAGRLAVLRSYGVLGVEHIITGWDHLLFVLALLLLIGWGRSLVWTITAFTVGHSSTLALAALGVVAVPQAPIEATIALSIFFLALELARQRRGVETLTERAPWAVASGFGVLHGLGFAGALSAVGLPAEEIPAALFSFNVGIEIGQLAFVAVALGVVKALRALPVRWPERLAVGPAYGIGSLGIYWFLERIAAMAGFPL